MGIAKPERLWEIDALRTLAIVLMVVYHAGYDVNLLTPDVAINPYDGLWRAVQVICGSLFLAIVGVSFWVSHARAISRGVSGMALWCVHAPRALEVLAGAAAVSLATRVALGPEDAVRFGILHLIGVLLLVVLPLLVRLGAWNAALGAAIVVTGLLVEAKSSVPGALVLGFVPPENGVDWYPLMPWAGAALLGLALSTRLYPDGSRGPLLRRLPRVSRLGTKAGGPGRHSLPIYLVHQPILVAAIAAILAIVGLEIDPS
ncbi:DUF1624 domain-containing protein [Conexibacter sp. W3-3-2]|uniref:heparan-alpha-glucosaminide N-acetyltransferase domain-containing protein n=1 Tax=Conexibacter sp. W3-3-2 TaxID=2675227 RepID=UPI0012B89225|nr:heparan-alpha-glucosaminide N-acetyltransferase domain-containing protein [Conexibacter sp. W3-3-2]MTD43676.1 DUF1624 domain-containing protein [Conexibacter sp. W3-3-2]